MARVSVEVPDGSLSEIAARAADRSQSIEEYLSERLRGWLAVTSADVNEILDRAGRDSGLSEDEAMEVALAEVRAVRAEAH